MKIMQVGISLGVLFALVITPLTVLASAAPVAPELVLRELKITGSEFVVVQATADIDHLNNYWLGYSSNDQATNIVPTQQMPDVPLQAGRAVLLTSDDSATCDAVYTSKLSPSLSDSGGRLELRRLTTDTAAQTSIFQTIDETHWIKPGKTAPPLSDTTELDLRQESGSGNSVWYHNPDWSEDWQVGELADCTLTFVSGSALLPLSSIVWPQADTNPPATIKSLADDASTSGPFLPLADIGLQAPQITELLPNPPGTGTDGTAEFIELYNPNTTVFDLSGFSLQTGLTTKHTYMFPAGTSLPSKSFAAFYSADTGLSLSNTSGQSDLLDPFGTVIAQTDPYGSVKDGMAWALAKSTWYWTVQPTPGTSNVIDQIVVSSGKQVSSKKTATAAAVKGAATTAATGVVNNMDTTTTAATSAPVHPGVLAAIVLAAVGYGVYEYRHDLENRIYQFRTNRAARRAARK